MTPQDARRFEADWRRRFERYALTHDSDALVSGWSEAGLHRRLALFASLLDSLRLPAPATALDLGCGGGTYVRLLGKLGHWAIGLDYSLPSVHRARQADPGRPGAYLAGDAGALPFPDRTFDLVVSIGVLQALGQPERAVGEMARVLRPGGVLVAEALNARAVVAGARRLREYVLRRPVRVRAYSPAAVRRWLGTAGLRVEGQQALLLPPRGRPALAWVLDARATQAAIRELPVALDLAAHSFLYIARKGEV